MGISVASGIFSGIDTDKIIEQLVALERRPLDRSLLRKASFEAEISSYGSLSSALSALRDSLSSLKSQSIASVIASSSDESVLTATVASSASEGSYNINVKNLATAQSINSATFTNESDTVADLSTFTTQKIKIQLGSNAAVEITVDSSNNTLAGIRDAINNAKAGVTASTVNDGTGYRLILSSDTSGTSNRATILIDENNNGTFEEATDETDTIGLSRLAFNATYDANGNVSGGITNLTQSQVAVDALLLVNGLTITRSANTIDDLITGVTINLLDNSSGNTVTLSISKDLNNITNSIKSFVSSYNSGIGLARSLSVPSKDQSVILAGDSTTRDIIRSLRTTITTLFAGNTPASFGLSHDKDGVLSLDSTILDNAIKNDLQGVLDTFDAMAKSFEDKIDNFVKTLIPARTDGINSSVDRIDDRIDVLERRLAQKEIRFRDQFSLLEQTLSQLQSKGDFLSQQLASLSSITNRNKR